MANDEYWRYKSSLYRPIMPGTERYKELEVMRLHDEEQRQLREQAAREIILNSDTFDKLLAGHDIDEFTKSFVIDAAVRQAAETRSGNLYESRELGRLLDRALEEGREQAEFQTEREASLGVDEEEMMVEHNRRRTNPVPTRVNAYQELKDTHDEISAAIEAVREQQQQEADRRQSLDPATRAASELEAPQSHDVTHFVDRHDSAAREVTFFEWDFEDEEIENDLGDR